VSLTLAWHSASAAVAEEPVPADRVMLVVRVPAQAKLTVESADTAQTGEERMFLSPSLPAGKAFVYTLVASWNEDGKERVATRRVPVRAGERTVVDLRGPAADAKEAAPKNRSFLLTYAAPVTDL